MQAEITKCGLGDATLNLVDTHGSPRGFDCNSSTISQPYIDRFVDHFNGSSKNPYNSEWPAADNDNCPTQLGRTGLSRIDDNTISVQTRYVDGENCMTA